MAPSSDTVDRLIVGWKVNQGLDPEYWMRPDAKPGKHTQDDLVSVNPSSVAKHTALIAQSGSGKSFFLGRLIEEITLKTQARLIIFDPNSDFRRLRDVSEEWSPENSTYDYKKRRGYLSDEESASEFRKPWADIPIAVHVADNKKQGPYRPLKLWWPSIPVEFLQEDVDAIGRNDMYHCHAFVRTVAGLLHNSGDKADLLRKARELLELARKVGSESFRRQLDNIFPDPKSTTPKTVQRVRASDILGNLINVGPVVDFWHELVPSIRRRLKDTLVDASVFVGDDIEQFYFGRAYRTNDSGILNVGSQEDDSYKGTAARVEVIDLPSIKDPSVQILTVSTLLDIEWNNARRHWARALAKPPKEDDRAPTLIVVDEAHNLISNEETRRTGEASLREQFRRIAAEGRKYGLFLLLVSQRPDKLDPLVLSECENKVIMRLGSESVLNVTRKLLGLEEVPEKILNKCLEFEQGRGLLLGDWVEGRPIYFYGAARRTVEGGRNLRPEAWAHRIAPKGVPTNAPSPTQTAEVDSGSPTTPQASPSGEKPVPGTPKS